MSFSDYLELKLLDHVTNKAAYTAAATLYVALFTAAPSDAAGSGTEVSGGSYARTSSPFATSAASGSIANSGAVTFPTASGSWGTVTHFALFDASTAGNMLMSAALTTSKTIGSGDIASFATGQLAITLD